MEVLTLMMARKVQENPSFKYHVGCKELKLTHICFADDLLVLSHGSISSIKVIKEALNEFCKTSGLLPNMSKSIIFFGNMNNIEKQKIIEILPFRIGILPMKWQWPNGWDEIFPEMVNIDVLVLQDGVEDKILWKSQSGNLSSFSVKNTWEDLGVKGKR
ncbi:hypothetical protein Tco_0032327 [Tanacetum coccineum]